MSWRTGEWVFVLAIVVGVILLLLACGLTVSTLGSTPAACVRGAPCSVDEDCGLVGRCRDGACWCGPYMLFLPHVVRNATR